MCDAYEHVRYVCMDHSNAYGCQWVDARVSSRVILRVSTAYQVSDSAAATLVFDCSFVVAIFFYMGTRYAILKRFLFFFRSEICNSSCSRSPSLAMTGSAVYSRLYAGFLRKRAELTLPLRRYLISAWRFCGGRNVWIRRPILWLRNTTIPNKAVDVEIPALWEFPKFGFQ